MNADKNKKVLYSSGIYDFDECRKECIESRLESGKKFDIEDICDSYVWDYISELEQDDFDMFKNSLEGFDKTLDGELIMIADIGTWKGRVSGYSCLCNIADMIKTFGDENEVFVEDGDLHVHSSDHDGSTSSVVRMIKPGRNSDILRAKIYNQNAEQSYIDNFTKKLGIKALEFWGIS